MPATTTAFVVGSAGLIGLLPLGGFRALQLGVADFWDEQPWIVGVLLLVNGLTALNLTRVFRLVFLGQAQPKTRRAPEVAWPMAVPMVFLTVLTLLIPLILQSLSLLPNWEYLDKTSVLLLILSSLVGGFTGATIYLHKVWSRSTYLPWRLLQDLLGYNFYIDRVYRLTVVFAVNLVSQCSAWLDRYVVDGVINFVGLASIFSGETLKYSISGQSQSYALTILLAVSFLGMLLSWPLWGFQVLDYLSKI
jgi:NAD(P)H-quinone oxidoreductase subunit 5